jgi:predicted transcriptional regulator
MPGEAELLAALEESEAEAEAGLFVPGDVVRRELLDSIARMEARAAGRTTKTAARR